MRQGSASLMHYPQSCVLDLILYRDLILPKTTGMYFEKHQLTFKLILIDEERTGAVEKSAVSYSLSLSTTTFSGLDISRFWD
jgi:hypothetical protein